jgi:hypothetical protein
MGQCIANAQSFLRCRFDTAEIANRPNILVSTLLHGEGFGWFLAGFWLVFGWFLAGAVDRLRHTPVAHAATPR